MKHCFKAVITVIALILVIGVFFCQALAAVSYCPDGKHSFGEWVTINPGNCGLPGEQMRRCTNILSNGNQCLKCEYRSIGVNPDIHGGLYVKNDKPATCTVAGYTGDTYCSMCFDENNEHTFVSAGEVIPPTGHDWGEWTVEHGATCIVRGSLTRTCQNCGKSDTVSLVTDPEQHMAAPVTQDIAPTCTEAGTSGRTVCPYCKAVIDPGTPVPPAGHSWGEWTTLSESTCAAQGTEQRICTVCGEVENRKLPYNPSRHTGRTRISGAKNPGCDTAGYSGDTVCSGCGVVLVKGETVPATGHDFSSWKVITPATCTAQGTSERTCVVCGKTETNKIPRTVDHNWGEWQTVISADCANQGKEERYCAVCGDKQIRTTDYAPSVHTGKTKLSGARAADCEPACSSGNLYLLIIPMNN
ncbi:MAG: hypothetical protein K6G90_02380 [Clostridia bacterium]|nr:hypothetical protein [Clostridia bacterium]